MRGIPKIKEIDSLEKIELSHFGQVGQWTLEILRPDPADPRRKPHAADICLVFNVGVKVASRICAGLVT